MAAHVAPVCFMSVSSLETDACLPTRIALVSARPVVRYTPFSHQLVKLDSSIHPRAGPARSWVCSSSTNVDVNEKLKDAAKAGDIAKVKELLKEPELRIDLCSDSRAGWNALHLSSFYGHPQIVEVLLDAGANLEVRNDSGNTALQLACLKGNIEIARVLLDSGADVTAESDDKGTALDYAMEWGGQEIVDFLHLWAAKSRIVE